MTLSLMPAVKEIVEQVREVTGKGIQFLEQEELPTYAGLRIARADMPSHIIFVKREHDEIIHHLVAHECGHILRLFSVPEEKRLVARTNDRIKLNALSRIEGEIQELSAVLPFDRLGQVVNLWYDGTVRQVTNFPPDIMIEKWLYDAYPNLREYQSASIAKQQRESLSGLSADAAGISPPTFIHLCNIMNYAFFRILGLHFGTNFVKPFSNMKYLEKGKKLAALTEEGYADNHEGDIEMANRWAGFLGISDWFEWARFDDGSIASE
jgi:hypothetical protein